MCILRVLVFEINDIRDVRVIFDVEVLIYVGIFYLRELFRDYVIYEEELFGVYEEI